MITNKYCFLVRYFRPNYELDIHSDDWMHASMLKNGTVSVEAESYDEAFEKAYAKAKEFGSVECLFYWPTVVDKLNWREYNDNT